MPESPFHVSSSTIIEDLLKALDRFGAKFQEPNGLKIELGSPESDAPRLIQHGSSVAPTCCDGDKRGIDVSFSASWTDASEGSSGLRRVKAHALDRRGHFNLFFDRGDTWDVDDSEQAQSKKGPVTHTFRLCVPCSSFTFDHTARFLLMAEDQAGNESWQIIGITVGADQFEKCCGG